MKTLKLLTAVLLSLCLALGMTGCSGDHIKDDVLNGFNDLLHHFSQYALTEEKDLQGDKTKGEDTYTGSYSAEYEDFSDVEYIFGGTGLDRDKGNDLTITYKLTIDEEKVIAENSGADTYSVALNTGDNYLTLEGDNFFGSLQVVVE